MSPAYLAYRRSEPYRRYLSNGYRLDDLMPPLDRRGESEAEIVPGELYCRFRSARGRLCHKVTFLKPSTLQFLPFAKPPL
ncbi:unnamed protein product [Fusarium fujikuroi]|uniref:Uncharacterized protein n=1 Tax=Fusarium fujikuroi TaxID=5127 RepID=A0A9Q9RAU5_FUSFU|nr:unnamed protein product [Fusarium fujikuroi]VTT58660.1 unnamed protein product [Fusarium fujikuroi]